MKTKTFDKLIDTVYIIGIIATIITLIGLLILEVLLKVGIGLTILAAILLIILIFSKEDMETEFKPFDVVIYKPTGERGLVKNVTDYGVFVLFNIQSTAHFCKFEDLELE